MPRHSLECCLTCLDCQPLVPETDEKIEITPLWPSHGGVIQLEFYNWENGGTV
jgi:hypothetical protein